MIKNKIDCDWSDSIGLLGYKDCCKNIMATPPLQWFFLAALVLIFWLTFRTCRISSEINRYNIFCDFPCSVRQWRQKALAHSGAIRRLSRSTKAKLPTPLPLLLLLLLLPLPSILLPRNPPPQAPPRYGYRLGASRPRTDPTHPHLHPVAPPF